MALGLPGSMAPCWDPRIFSFFLASQKGKLSHRVMHLQLTLHVKSRVEA